MQSLEWNFKFDDNCTNCDLIMGDDDVIIVGDLLIDFFQQQDIGKMAFFDVLISQKFLMVACVQYSS